MTAPKNRVWLTAVLSASAFLLGLVWLFTPPAREAIDEEKSGDLTGKPPGTAPQVPSGTGEKAPEPPTYPSPEEVRKNWPRFRGPEGLGISVHTNVPASWNGKTGEGVLWRARVPLKGASSPVIWGDRVFLTGADKERREVYCFGANSGKLLWQRRVENVPTGGLALPEVWDDKTYAAATPVTDGRRIYAAFANADLVCFDFEGTQVWARGLGPLKNDYGHASSLAMYRNLLLVQLDQAKLKDGRSRSKLMALDAATGQTVWETRRPVPESWSTPIVISIAGRGQIITCANPWVIAYGALTGGEIWRVKCLGGNIVPSPIYADGLVYVAMEGADLVAIKPDGQGDVTETRVVWRAEGDLPSICSPLYARGLLFLLVSSGILTCWNARDGKMLWEKDVEVSVVSSPSLVGDRIYMFSDEGVAVIFKAGAEYEEIDRPELGEHCQASPAFLDGRIYVRGEQHLFCIGQK